VGGGRDSRKTKLSYPEVGRAIKKIHEEARAAGRPAPSAYQIWKCLETLRRRVGSKAKKDPKERRPELDRARAVQMYLEGRRYAEQNAENLGEGN